MTDPNSFEHRLYDHTDDPNSIPLSEDDEAHHAAMAHAAMIPGDWSMWT